MNTGLSHLGMAAAVAVATLLVLAGAVSGGTADHEAADDVTDFLHVSLKDLQEGRPETLALVKDAATQHGVFAVVDSAPQATQSDALSAFVACVQQEDIDSASKTVVLSDNTKRSTLATATNAGEPLPFHEKVESLCPDFSSAAGSLRKAVDDTVHAYAQALDKMAAGEQAEAQPFDSFAEAIGSAESLEHFHLFRRDSAPPAGASALDMHTDMGLFIVMTPAAYLLLESGSPSEEEGAGRAPGLKVKLADGTVTEARFRPGSLIVMNGEGSNRWMQHPMGDMLLPPEHEVSFPYEEGVGRAWFGRMVFPSGDAVMKGDDIATAAPTFREYRTQTYNAFKSGRPEEAMSAGCYPRPGASHAHAEQRRHMLASHEDEHSCENADEVYCWMACRSMENITGCSTEEVLCLNLTSYKPWEEGVHCMTCGLICPTDVPSTATPVPTPQSATPTPTPQSPGDSAATSYASALVAAVLGMAAWACLIL